MMRASGWVRMNASSPLTANPGHGLGSGRTSGAPKFGCGPVHLKQNMLSWSAAFIGVMRSPQRPDQRLQHRNTLCEQRQLVVIAQPLPRDGGQRRPERKSDECRV